MCANGTREKVRRFSTKKCAHEQSSRVIAGRFSGMFCLCSTGSYSHQQRRNIHDAAQGRAKRAICSTVNVFRVVFKRSRETKEADKNCDYCCGIVISCYTTAAISGAAAEFYVHSVHYVHYVHRNDTEASAVGVYALD